MKRHFTPKSLAPMVLAMAVTVVAPAMAVDDYGTVLAGLSALTAIAAILSAGAIKASVGFAKWAVNKVASFFR